MTLITRSVAWDWAMIRFAEEQTISNGLREIRLFTNVLMTENLDYYSKLGYREYDRRTEDGYARVFMKKTLCGGIAEASGSTKMNRP